jgi:hypothetical protein
MKTIGVKNWYNFVKFDYLHIDPNVIAGPTEALQQRQAEKVVVEIDQAEIRLYLIDGSVHLQ